MERAFGGSTLGAPPSSETVADFAHLSILERAHAAMENRMHMPREALACLDAKLRLQLKMFGDDNSVVQESRRQLIVGLNTTAMGLLAEQGPAACRDMLSKAQVLADAGSDAALRVLTLNNMACVHRQLGDIDTSLELLHSALRAAQAQSDCAVATTHLNFCALFHALAQHDRALGHAQSAVFHAQEELAAASSGQSRTGEASDGTERGVTLAIAYHNMAVELERTGRLPSSMRWYHKAVRALRPFQSACPGLFESFARASVLVEQKAALEPDALQVQELHPVQKRHERMSPAGNKGRRVSSRGSTLQPQLALPNPRIRDAWASPRVLAGASSAPHVTAATITDPVPPAQLLVESGDTEDVCDPHEASSSEWERTVEDAEERWYTSPEGAISAVRRRRRLSHSTTSRIPEQQVSPSNTQLRHSPVAALRAEQRLPLADHRGLPAQYLEGTEPQFMAELDVSTAARMQEKEVQRTRRRRRRKQQARMQKKKEKRDALLKMVRAHQMAEDALQFLKQEASSSAPQRHEAAQLEQEAHLAASSKLPAERLGLSTRLRDAVQAGQVPWADAVRVNRAATCIHNWLRRKWRAAALCCDSAACIVQCAVRCRQARNAASRRQWHALRCLAATRLQEFFLVRVQHARAEASCDLRKCVVMIQSIARGFLLRKRARILRAIQAEVFCAAAVVLQANWRMWSSQSARADLSASRLDMVASTRRNAVLAAVLTIQAHWRMLLSYGRYKQYQTMREEHLRTRMEEQATRKQEHSAAARERRGHAAAKQEQRAFGQQARATACIQLQALARGVLSRRSRAQIVTKLLWQRPEVQNRASREDQPAVARSPAKTVATTLKRVLPRTHEVKPCRRKDKRKDKPTKNDVSSRSEWGVTTVSMPGSLAASKLATPAARGQEPSALLRESEVRGRETAKRAQARSLEVQQSRDAQRRAEARQRGMETATDHSQVSEPSVNLQRSEERGRAAARRARADSIAAKQARDTQRRLKARQHAAHLVLAQTTEKSRTSAVLQRSEERARTIAATSHTNSEQAQKVRETQRRLEARAKANEDEIAQREQARARSRRKRRLATEKRLRAAYEAAVRREATHAAREDAHQTLVHYTAAVAIQASYRGYSVRYRAQEQLGIFQARQVEDMAAVCVQSWLRKSVARHRYVRLWAVSKARVKESLAAIGIQSSWRAWVARRIFSLLILVRNCAVIVVQSHCRGTLGRAYVARHRAELAEAAQRSLALLTVGARLLGIVGRNRVTRWRRQRITLALALQRTWRAFAARKHLLGLQQERELLLQTRIAATLCVQTWWRGEVAKRCLRLLRTQARAWRSARAVQGAWRHYSARRAIKRYMEQQSTKRYVAVAAATLLQALARRRTAMRRAHNMRQVIEIAHVAAMTIQRTWRGKAARARFQIVRAEHEVVTRLDAAVLRLQSAWRRMAAMIRCEALRAARDRLIRSAVVIQARRRRRVCQIAFTKAVGAQRLQLFLSETAAIMVQSRVRMYRAVARVKTLRQQKGIARIAATTIQAVARKSIAICAVHRKRALAVATCLAENAAIALQRTYRGKTGRERAGALYRARQQTTAAQESASTTVQAVWRGRSARGQVHEMQNAAVADAAAITVQSAFRSKAGREHARAISRARLQATATRESASTTVQAVWRSKCARKSVCKQRTAQSLEARRAQQALLAAVVLQGVWRGWLASKTTKQRRGEHERKRMCQVVAQTQHAQHAAATTMQSAARRWFAQRRRLAQHQAAMLLQCCARARLTRRILLLLTSSREAAATTIQTQWRSRAVHMALLEMEGHREHAATIIQSLIRGSVARYQSQTRAAEKTVALSEHSSSTLMHQRQEVILACVTTIQATWRGHRGRMISGWRRETADAESAAALLLQCMWRGHLGRNQSLERADTIQVSLTAAVLVQCTWRGHLGRMRAQRVQATLDAAHTGIAAATMIQCAWRGFVQRVRVGMVREESDARVSAAVQIQCGWREHKNGARLSISARSIAGSPHKIEHAGQKASMANRTCTTHATGQLTPVERRAARRQRRQERYRQVEAAVCLQARVRTALAKNGSAALRAARRADKAAAAVIVLQSLFRSQVSRRRTATRRQQLERSTAAANATRKAARRQRREERYRQIEAAICLQAYARAVLAKKGLATLQARRMDGAIALQSAARRFAARNHAQKRAYERQEAKRAAGAIALQCLARGVAARKHAKTTMHANQGKARQGKALIQAGAAQRIQAAFRGQRARHAWKMVTSAIRGKARQGTTLTHAGAAQRIQAAFRGRRARHAWKMILRAIRKA